jgi:hypothetical protein
MTDESAGCSGRSRGSPDDERAGDAPAPQGGATACAGPTRIIDFVDAALPGAEIVERGIEDLARGVESQEALLVSIGAPRLRRIGFAVSRTLPAPEDRLYELLSRVDSDSAHSRYNALIRRLVSFERAAECAAR